MFLVMRQGSETRQHICRGGGTYKLEVLLQISTSVLVMNNTASKLHSKVPVVQMQYFVCSKVTNFLKW